MTVFGSFNEVDQSHWWSDFPHESKCTFPRKQYLDGIAGVVEVADLMGVADEVWGAREAPHRPQQLSIANRFFRVKLGRGGCCCATGRHLSSNRTFGVTKLASPSN